MGFEIDRRTALDLWRDVTVMTVQADEPDLTARQLAVLMTVYLKPAPHTVRALAAALGLAKPAVTRALDTLARHGLIERAPDESDGRSVLIQRTARGQTFLADFADAIAGRAAALVR